MTTPQKGRIFISYRRSDSAGYAGRIYDRLTAHFGVDVVFMDVDTIEAGVDFVEVLQNAVQSCDVLVALIGRSWLNIKDETGERRLDNPKDFVRVEIAAALSRGIRVIPVLVDDTPMPRSTELPDHLIALARRNALQVDHDSFNADSQRLISQLELALSAAERARVEKARREQEEREKKVLEEKRVQEAAAKAAREREEHDRKEREERAQKEKETRMKAIAEEKARRAALRKQRQQKFFEHIKNIFRSGRKLPFFIGGGIVIVFLLGYIFKIVIDSPPTPTAPIEVSETFVLPSVTVTSTEILLTPTPTKSNPALITQTITPIDTDTGNSSILFFEDFDDGKAQLIDADDGWEVIVDETGNSVYSIDANTNGSFPTASFGQDGWDDYAVEFRVKFLELKGRTVAYVAYRASKTKKYEFALEPIFKKHQLAFWQNQGTSWNVLDEHSFDFVVGEWYSIRVEIKNTIMKAYIGDKLVASATDTQLSKGKLNLIVGPNTRAYFDDIQVTSLNK